MIPDHAIIQAWLEFAVRWTHVIVGIAWIGSSFYFIALDLGLRRGIPGPADGEEWQVHGGGFYHIQKYMVAPEGMPEHLTWFKWESYATWLSGATLLILVYWIGAELYLIDPTVWDAPVWAAVAISAGSLIGGWLAYDALCRSRLGHSPGALMLVLFAILVATAWGYAQVFSGRAAMLHTGALTATIMTGNVFRVIIPNQKVVVADLRAGRRPDPEYGRIAKLRSTHNNYLTLPVIFLMLSHHYPLAFATEWSWAIAALVFLMGVTIRHYFNTMHATGRRPHWTWAATASLFVAIMWLSTGPGIEAEAAPGRAEIRAAEAEGFAEVVNVVQGRCAMCHAAEPVWPGLHWAPLGVRLDGPDHVARHARGIYLQSGVSHAMPPGNRTWMEPEERALIREWYEAGR
jgi:uncharacterized membrane protein